MGAFFTSTVLEKETYVFIILGVVLKHRSTNFTLVESPFAWKDRIYILNGTPKVFYIYTYVRIIILEEESTSVSINIFEGLERGIQQHRYSWCIRNRNVQIITWH